MADAGGVPSGRGGDERELPSSSHSNSQSAADSAAHVTATDDLNTAPAAPGSSDGLVSEGAHLPAIASQATNSGSSAQEGVSSGEGEPPAPPAVVPFMPSAGAREPEEQGEDAGDSQGARSSPQAAKLPERQQAARDPVAPEEAPASAAAAAPSRARARGRSQLPAVTAAGQPALGRRATGAAGVGSEDASSSASRQASPEVNRTRVAAAAARPRELVVDSAGTDELELSVPSYQEHLTSDGQRYTTYEIVVRMGGRQWSVRKRYTQFDQFRLSLRRQHKEVGSFRFPNKSKFNTFAEHTKERRRTGFDEFLRLVAGLHPRPQEVDVFLAMDEHGAGVSARAGNRQLAWTTEKVVSPATTPSDSALARGWASGGSSRTGSRLPTTAPGSGHPHKGQSTHRMPRFPPLADQGRSEKAAEAAEAAAAAAGASRDGPAGLVRQVDTMLKRVLGPDFLSILCVVAVSAVSIVAVWKVGGRPGLATLITAVTVGLLIQHWDAGLDVLSFMLELVGIAPEGPSEAPTRTPPPDVRFGEQAAGSRSTSSSASLGQARQLSNARENRRP